MIIDPRHLIQLSVTVELGSFSLAAESLFLTQPALSRNIRILEERIGIQLIDRSRKKIAVTEAGKVFALQGRVIRIATNQAALFTEDVKQGVAGVLKLGTTPIIAGYLIGKPISSFLGNNPNVSCVFSSAMMQDLHEKLIRGELDVLIGPISLIHEDSGLTAIKLWDDTVKIFCNPSHPLTHKTSVSIQDLRNEKWIVHDDRSSLRSQMESYLTSSGVSEISVAIESESNAATTITEILQNSNFLTMLPLVPLKPLLNQGKLATLNFPADPPSRATGLIVRKNNNTPLIDHFCDAMKVHFQHK